MENNDKSNDNEKLNKVLIHPEKEEIIKRLLQGESVKEIELWLKSRHPKKRKLWISYATLQKFRKNHLQLEGDILEDIKAAKKDITYDSVALEARAILGASSSYQKKINEIVDNKLDADRKMLEMMALTSSRLEYYFNILQDPKYSGIKEDKMLVELLNLQRGLVQDWKKYVDGVADQKIEHTFNINIVNEQVSVLKNIVFQVLQEMNPELIPVFMEKVNSRLLDLNYGTDKYNRYQDQESSFKRLAVIDAE